MLTSLKKEMCTHLIANLHPYIYIPHIIYIVTYIHTRIWCANNQYYIYLKYIDLLRSKALQFPDQRCSLCLCRLQASLHLTGWYASNAYDTVISWDCLVIHRDLVSNSGDIHGYRMVKYGLMHVNIHPEIGFLWIWWGFSGISWLFHGTWWDFMGIWLEFIGIYLRINGDCPNPC